MNHRLICLALCCAALISPANAIACNCAPNYKLDKNFIRYNLIRFDAVVLATPLSPKVHPTTKRIDVQLDTAMEYRVMAVWKGNETPTINVIFDSIGRGTCGPIVDREADADETQLLYLEGPDGKGRYHVPPCGLVRTGRLLRPEVELLDEIRTPAFFPSGQ